MCFSYKPALECAFIAIFFVSVVFLVGCSVFCFFSWLFCDFFFFNLWSELLGWFFMLFCPWAEAEYLVDKSTE